LIYNLIKHPCPQGIFKRIDDRHAAIAKKIKVREKPEKGVKGDFPLVMISGRSPDASFKFKLHKNMPSRPRRTGRKACFYAI